MTDEVTIKERVIRWTALLLVALLGAGAKHMRERQNGADVTLTDFCGRIVIAGFAGIITILMCREYDVSEYMTGVVTGIAGYAAPEAIDSIRRFVVGRYGS